MAENSDSIPNSSRKPFYLRRNPQLFRENLSKSRKNGALFRENLSEFRKNVALFRELEMISYFIKTTLK
jgi:hypothetical protein